MTFPKSLYETCLEQVTPRHFKKLSKHHQLDVLELWKCKHNVIFQTTLVKLRRKVLKRHMQRRFRASMVHLRWNVLRRRILQSFNP